ncbi:MAG: DUF192 domain-containing protein [Bacteroidota bacterium]
MLGCTGKEDNHASKEKSSSGRTISYNEGRLAFLNTTRSDTIATISIAIADEAQERNEGLMDVEKLPASAGMLFIFDQERERSFWMANTPLSLDILFVNADYRIVTIHHRTQPYSQDQYSSIQPAQYVVETNAGFCQRYDIREGMAISFQKK